MSNYVRPEVKEVTSKEVGLWREKKTVLYNIMTVYNGRQ